MTTSPASLSLKGNQLQLSGHWTVKGIQPLEKAPFAGLILPTHALTLCAKAVEELDVAGALLLHRITDSLKQQHIPVQWLNLTHKQQMILDLVSKSADAATQAKNLKKAKAPNPFAKLGKTIVEKLNLAMQWQTFIGEVFLKFLTLFRHPWRIKWSYISHVIETMGVYALPIVALLSLLIGVVLTYQIGLQLKLYGANIYIIGLLGLAILREFGPLITAIILAGRTSSAFTAQIGLMKANEEVDALKSMGLSPAELLIIPKIIGLLIVMPLLTVWADIFGVLGGMLMTKAVLGISYTTFINQFPQDVSLTTFLIGLSKAPAFAMIIAAVGCFHGLKVSGSSDSIGMQTTKSVVLAIFLVIIVDAIFSVILSWWNI